MSKPPNLKDSKDCGNCKYCENRREYGGGDDYWCLKYDYHMGWDSELIYDDYEEL